MAEQLPAESRHVHDQVILRALAWRDTIGSAAEAEEHAEQQLVKAIDTLRIHLAAWAPPVDGPFRTGRSLGRTIYGGDHLIGLRDTPALAGMVVAALNATTPATAPESPDIPEHQPEPAKPALAILSPFPGAPDPSLDPPGSASIPIEDVRTFRHAYDAAEEAIYAIAGGEGVDVDTEATRAGLAAVGQQRTNEPPDIRAAAQLVLDGTLDMAVCARAAWLNASEDWRPEDEPRVDELPPAIASDTAELARLREQNQQLNAVISLGYDRAREATERWKAEDPDARKNVLLADAGTLLAWLMADADKARAQTAEVLRDLEGVHWTELDAGFDEPRMTITGDMETLRHLAGRLGPADTSDAASQQPDREIERLRKALQVCEHHAGLTRPTDAETMAAQEASAAWWTNWQPEHVNNDLPEFKYREQP